MAVNLVSSLAVEFEPGKFQNEYREALLERIGAKVAGQEIVDVEQPVQQGRVVDLMEALRASIRQAEQGVGADGGDRVGPPGAAKPGAGLARVGAPRAARGDLPPVPIPGAAPRTAPHPPTGLTPGAAPTPQRVPPA